MGGILTLTPTLTLVDAYRLQVNCHVAVALAECSMAADADAADAVAAAATAACRAAFRAAATLAAATLDATTTASFAFTTIADGAVVVAGLLLLNYLPLLALGELWVVFHL